MGLWSKSFIKAQEQGTREQLHQPKETITLPTTKAVQAHDSVFLSVTQFVEQRMYAGPPTINRATIASANAVCPIPTFPTFPTFSTFPVTSMTCS